MTRAASLTPDFDETEVTVRGTTFRLRELSIGDYDDLVKKATTKQVNASTGEEVELIDNTLLLKMMVLRCSVEPKLTAEKLANLPMRIVLKLNQTVNKMHYGDEPETEKKDDDGDDIPGDTAKGNA